MTISKELLDELLKGCERPEDLLGDAGLIKELKIRLMERMLGAKMRGQLGTQHPFHQPDLELLHQPGIAKQILRSLAALQKFVQQFLGNRHRPCSSQEAWTRSQLHRRPDTLYGKRRRSFAWRHTCSMNSTWRSG